MWQNFYLRFCGALSGWMFRRQKLDALNLQVFKSLSILFAFFFLSLE
jgi:hypothetical protein